MQYQTAIATLSRIVILTVALLLSIGFGNVAAQGVNGPSLTECDAPGCAVAYPKGNATFQIVSSDAFDQASPFVARGRLEMGFTR